MDFAFFFADWLGKPVWMWLGFLSIVVSLLALDLGVLHRDNREIGVRESLILSSMYIALGLAFGGWIWWQNRQQQQASEQGEALIANRLALALELLGRDAQLVEAVADQHSQLVAILYLVREGRLAVHLDLRV